MQSRLAHSVVVAAHGAAEALQWREGAPVDELERALAPDEVLVRASFAGVNFIDTYHRSGLYPAPRPLPFVLGSEGAGCVVAAGAAAASTKPPGTRVAYFTTRSGAYSTFVTVAAEDAFVIPDDVADDVAAAVLLQGCTAHYLCTSCRAVGQGDIVLIHAAAGGTGLLLSQMCREKGATVIGTCGGPEKRQLALATGRCDHVIDYNATPDWWEQVRAIAPRGVDAVLDGVGKATFARGLEVLKPRGDMISFGNASGPVDPIAPLMLTKHGSIRLQRPKLGDFASHEGGEIEQRVHEIFSMIGSKKLAVTIGKVFPLHEAVEAHRFLEGRGSTGKILLMLQNKGN